ncbi:hypothetical protein ACFSQT_24835 [Mesorhizobium calcicola]|uniref:Uncharacterized protein n=1 Tax=Mesorhizobium calcicola TaxID=1300310 RepID=A0ABW4WJF2_9HYPH
MTILTIAHRSSMIAFADWVVAMENGRAIEVGQYQRLKEKAGSRLSRMPSGEQSERDATWPEARAPSALVQAAPGAQLLAFVHLGRTQLSFGVANPVGRRRRAPGDHRVDEREVTRLNDDGADDDADQRRAYRRAAQPGPTNDDSQSEYHPDDEFWKCHTQQPINRLGYI